MLTYFFEKLNNKYIKSLTNFLYSNLFIILCVVLMLFSNLFSFEILVYYIFTVLAIVIILFCEDITPTIPIMTVCYMTVSRNNSPIINENSLLYSDIFLINIIIISSIISVFLIARLIFDLKFNPKKNKPRFIIGFVIMLIGFVLGGVSTNTYSLKSVLYGLLVLISLAIPYYLLFYTVKKENLKKDYFAYLFLCVGLGIFIELIYLYFINGFNQELFSRQNLITGWGVCNNIGAVLCTCLGGSFYLSIKKNKGYIYSILTNVIYIGIILSQSRTSILMGTILYITSIFILIFSKKWKELKSHFYVYLSVLILMILFLLFQFENFKKIFDSLLYIKFNDNGRWNLYKNGLKAFLKNPIFGTGFFDYNHSVSIYFSIESFLAPRYHNTIIQIIASTGLIGITGYIIHRINTLKLLFKNKSLEKTFITICIVAILITSLFDCHLFNFGPGIHYSVLLLFLDKANENKEIENKALE